MGRDSGAIELIFSGEVQEILDLFTGVFDIRIAYYSPGGRELRAGLAKAGCRYCRLLRERCAMEPECRALDRARRAEAARTGRLVAYRCHAGMTEAIVPVALGGGPAGFIMIGQFRTGAKVPGAILRRWRAAGGQADDLEAAFLEAPAYDERRAGGIVKLFELLVRFIVSRRMVTVAGRSPLEPLLSYMEEHPEEHLSLADATRMTFRSRSTLSHAFKRSLGKGLKRHQTELRLKAADELLASEPGLTVAEISRRLGYADPLYFSRLYRRHRGRPPSAGRRKSATDGHG